MRPAAKWPGAAPVAWRAASSARGSAPPCAAQPIGRVTHRAEWGLPDCAGRSDGAHRLHRLAPSAFSDRECWRAWGGAARAPSRRAARSSRAPPAHIGTRSCRWARGATRGITSQRRTRRRSAVPRRNTLQHVEPQCRAATPYNTLKLRTQHVATPYNTLQRTERLPLHRPRSWMRGTGRAFPRARRVCVGRRKWERRRARGQVGHTRKWEAQKHKWEQEDHAGSSAGTRARTARSLRLQRSSLSFSSSSSTAATTIPFPAPSPSPSPAASATPADRPMPTATSAARQSSISTPAIASSSARSRRT